MKGHIVVDFAGTNEEAAAFAKEHAAFNFKAPRLRYPGAALNREGEYPQISVSCENNTELYLAAERLKELGFDLDFQAIELEATPAERKKMNTGKTYDMVANFIDHLRAAYLHKQGQTC